MKKLRPILMLVVFLGIVAGGVWLGLFLTRFLKGTGPTFRNTATILQQVQTISELVTVKYVMEKVVVLEDVKWYGENRVLLVAHGVAKAGVDLSQLKEGDIQTNGDRITIRLPQPQIIDCYLDEKHTSVIERSTGLLRTFDKDLEQTARRQAVADMRTSARVNGILKDADDRVRWQLIFLFHQMGFQQVDFLQD